MGENIVLDKLLLLFGLMKKAGRIEIGDEPVTDALRRGDAVAVCCASDASDNTMRHFQRAAEGEDIPLLNLHSDKAELGEVFGRNTVAVVALTDIGFAAKLFELCAVDDPHWKSTAEKFRRESDELIAEQKRRRREEKEAKTGKRPKAAPPAKSEPSKDETAKPVRKKQEPQNRSYGEKSFDSGKKFYGERSGFEKKPYGERSGFGKKSYDRNSGNGQDYSDSGRTYGKIYGKAPKAKPVTIGERRREDAQRINERFGGAPSDSRGGYRSSNGKYGERSGSRQTRFNNKSGEKSGERRTPNAYNRGTTSVNRRNGGKA